MKLDSTVWAHNGDDDKEKYHYTGCGLPNIYLVSGYEFNKTPYGRGVSIKNIDALHAQIGLYLVAYHKDLTGAELKFLRHQMDLTQSELARLFGCSAQQVARYENNKNNINGPADRMLRILFKEHVEKGSNVRTLLELLDEMDSDNDGQNLVFADVDGRWKIAS